MKPFTAMRLSVLLLSVLLTTACIPKTSKPTAPLTLAERIQLMEKENDSSEMWYWLNLGRLYQQNGEYQKSMDAFGQAERILVEYEGRALVSARNVASGAGSALLATGAQRYYGKGYERSLMHTLNSLNYLMLHDFDGASVELKKMEERQEKWLVEVGDKIKDAAEQKQKNAAALEGVDADKTPDAFSMKAMLEDPELNNLVNNYQDAFSYSLSAIVTRLAGDEQWAEVSANRACLLNRNAESLIKPATIQVAQGRAEALPVAKASLKEKKGAKKKKAPEPLAPAPAAAPKVDVTVIVLTGLAPKLKIESLPFPIGQLNYTTLELPSYDSQGDDPAPVTVSGPDGPALPTRLLDSSRMAYRTLKDEFPGEMLKAILRTVAKGAAATAMGKQNELLGLATSGLLHLTTAAMNDSYRNWEMLPNSGYLARLSGNKGQTVDIGVGGVTQSVVIQDDAQKGQFIFVSLLGSGDVKTASVAY